jgi:hypothetical protein
MNEKSEMNNFQCSRRPSNIDLTISNNRLLKEVQEWEISEEEICTDHKIIHFYIASWKQFSTYKIFNQRREPQKI